jgi:hypothetical protein
MRHHLIIMLLTMVPATAIAQNSSERDAVLKAVQMFFDTMTARDVDAMRRIMVPRGHFHAMDMRTPKIDPVLLSTEEALAGLQKTKYTSRERIWNPEVRVHGLIATVWAPYDLWVDGKYSHCGVDAFDLIKTTDGWKIAGGAFTMEAKCGPSPLGPLKK